MAYISSATELAFSLGLLILVSAHLAIRAGGNKRLPPEQRFGCFNSPGNTWWGRGGMLNMHAQFYPTSGLRLLFWLGLATVLAAFAVAALR